MLVHEFALFMAWGDAAVAGYPIHGCLLCLQYQKSMVVSNFNGRREMAQSREKRAPSS